MDKDSLFQPILLSSNSPSWFDRRILKGLTQFGPDDHDRFTVFVTPDAVIDLHKGTLQHAPDEAYGLLMGRVYADKIGIFTIISRAIYANEYEKSSNHIQLSHEEVEKLYSLARRTHPVGDIIGWTHSHDCLSEYSDVDYREQQTWDESYHVGILTFMDNVAEPKNSPWCVAYRGPEAGILYLTKDITLSLIKNGSLPPFTEKEPTPQNSSSTKTIQEIPSFSIVEKTQTQKKSSKPRWLFVSMGSVFLIVFILAIVVTGVVLGNTFSSSWQQFSSTLSSTSLLWDCDQQTGLAPLKVTCVGPVGPTIKGWMWDFGDGTKIQKNIATHLYRKAGEYEIRLTIIASSSNQSAATFNINAGSLIIKVTSSSP
jgi:proteasome lid subunit RPN8/RPN11